MLPCHGCYICGTWGSKEVGGLKLSYGGTGKCHKQKKLLWGAIRKQLNYSMWNYQPISTSCGVKRYMHYIRFPLTKNSLAKFESIFPLGSFFIYIIDFLSICE